MVCDDCHGVFAARGGRTFREGDGRGVLLGTCFHGQGCNSRSRPGLTIASPCLRFLPRIDRRPLFLWSVLPRNWRLTRNATNQGELTGEGRNGVWDRKWCAYFSRCILHALADRVVCMFETIPSLLVADLEKAYSVNLAQILQ